MKKFTALFLALSLLLTLIACGAKGAWQEKYDLGMRCLNEGNYQEAVIAFEAAIEIDPKRPEAYLGAAEAYIAADDIDAAIAILEKGYAATNDETLKKRLDEIKSGTFSDYWGRAKQLSGYDENGALVWYHLYTYDTQGRTASVTSYDAAGNQTSHVDCEYDAKGNEIVSFGYSVNDGTLIGIEKTYNTGGLVTKETNIYSDGRSINYTTFQYDQNGYCIRKNMYNKNILYGYCTYENNGDGKCNKETEYNADGEILWYYTFAYNEAGDLIEQRFYSSDGRLTKHRILYYDDYGNFTGHDWYDSEGNLTGSQSYQD